jgi:hypothetical protein
MGMTLLDHGQPPDTTTKKHHTGLIAALAVLAMALLAAGAWLIIDSQQQPLSAEEQQAAIMDVVTAHRDALEAGDRDAILATLTDDATALYMRSAYGSQLVWSKDDYVPFADGDRLIFFDDPAFFGDKQVSIPTRAEYPRKWTSPSNGGLGPMRLEEPRVGTYIFTLREVDGQLKIATIVMNVT